MAAASDRTIALISIHPQHARAILSRTKKVEFRKTNFNPAIKKVVLYATAPVSKIIAYFDVAHVTQIPPVTLWERFEHIGGISRQVFDDYFKEATLGTAIGIRAVHSLAEPLQISDVSEGLRPPQSFIYLSEDQFRRIVNSNRSGHEKSTTS